MPWWGICSGTATCWAGCWAPPQNACQSSDLEILGVLPTYMLFWHRSVYDTLSTSPLDNMLALETFSSMDTEQDDGLSGGALCVWSLLVEVILLVMWAGRGGHLERATWGT